MIKFILIALIGDLMSLFGVFAGQYTIMSHVLIFSNLGGVILVVFSLARGEFVHKLEIIGTIIAIMGCSVSIMDGNAKKVDTSQQDIPYGDVLAFFSSIFSAIYFQANQGMVKQMPPLLATTIIMMF